MFRFFSTSILIALLFAVALAEERRIRALYSSTKTTNRNTTVHHNYAGRNVNASHGSSNSVDNSSNSYSGSHASGYGYQRYQKPVPYNKNSSINDLPYPPDYRHGRH